MTKTLIVQYTPRGERSKTRQLLDHFKLNIKDSTVEILDLTEHVPDVFLPENLAAYYERNYGGKTLTATQSIALSKMDAMTRQLKDADIVVLAYPMYNFSLPAVVKAWFDSVALKGETWDVGSAGYIGLMKGKKALVITTSAGDYMGQMASWDHSVTLAQQLFSFMGYTVDAVSAGSANGASADAKTKLDTVATTLY